MGRGSHMPRLTEEGESGPQFFSLNSNFSLVLKGSPHRDNSGGNSKKAPQNIQTNQSNFDPGTLIVIIQYLFENP